MTALRTLQPVLPASLSSVDPGRGDGPVAIERVRQLRAGLDRRQRQAVTHGDGPLLVVAGPGTGKTEVITRRIAWLIATRRARAGEILALTFTERAADEMQARVDLLLPYGQVETAIHTFHAFGDRLLREYGSQIGRTEDPRVIGRSEAVVLLRDHVFELELDRYRPAGDPTRFAGAMVDLFARAKEEGVGPDDLASYATELRAGADAARRGLGEGGPDETIDALLDEASGWQELAHAYAVYQRLLADRSLVDHGDQVAEAVRLLEERPAVRMALRRRFRYVVVDEAQDANPQQLQLVRLLVGKVGNVAFVGDDDQAIYSFRGAVGAALAALDGTYEGLRHIVLARNYRSRAPILEAARRLIRHNDPERLEVTRGLDKTLTVTRRARRPAAVVHRAYTTVDEEADAVAHDVRRRLEAGLAPRSVAVLVRTNADAGPILASLDALGVPRRFSGASGLFGHRDVRDAYSLLRAIATPESSEDLYAVLTSPVYGLGGEELTAICGMAQRRRRSLWSIATELVEQPGLLRLPSETRKRLERFVADMRASMGAAHERSAPAVLYEHLRSSGWLARLVAQAEQGDDAPLRRLARLFELIRSQSELLSDPRAAVIVPALRSLLDAGHDPAAPESDDDVEAVFVLTVHQAKGLEFEVVYVIGLADGRFPIKARVEPLALPSALSQGQTSERLDQQRAEERRLLYVAMTRAREELVLTHAAAAARGGRHRRPSPFLAEALGTAVDDVRLGDRDRQVLPAPAEPRSMARPNRLERQGHPGDLELSFTQIDDYLACPFRYYLRHRVRVPTAPNHALVFGNALHQAVAAANLARLRGRAVEPAAIREVLATHWQSEGFLSADHEAARYAAGLSAVDRFLAQSSVNPQERILAVEEPFSVRIGVDRVRGRYDAIRETADGTVITDYKSSDVRDASRAGQRARSSLQLQLYTLAYEAQTGRRPDAVELHFLEGGAIGRVVPTERQLERARAKVADVAGGIREGRFEATPGYPACDWCPYRRICPSAAA